MTLLPEIAPATDTTLADARRHPDVPPDYIMGKWSVTCTLTLRYRRNHGPALPLLQRWAERWGQRHGGRPVSSVVLRTNDQPSPGSMFAPEKRTIIVRWKA